MAIQTLRSEISTLTLFIFMLISFAIFFGVYLQLSNYARITQHYHDYTLAEFHFDNPEQPLASDVGDYKLSYTTGTYVITDGYIQKGIELNGDSLYLDLGTQSRLTAVVWSKYEGITYRPLSIWIRGGRFRLYWEAEGNKAKFYIWNSGSVMASWSFDIDPEDWHHFGIFFNYNTDRIIAYLDGNVVVNTTDYTVPSRFAVSVRINTTSAQTGKDDELLIFASRNDDLVNQMANSVYYFLPENLRNYIEKIIAIIFLTFLILVIKVAFQSAKSGRPLLAPPGHFFGYLTYFVIYLILTVMITISAILGVNVISFLNIVGADGFAPQLIQILWAGLLVQYGILLYLITSYT